MFELTVPGLYSHFFQEDRQLASQITTTIEWTGTNSSRSSFFQNEVIFVELDELDKLDKITRAGIEFNYSLTQDQKMFQCNG